MERPGGAGPRLANPEVRAGDDAHLLGQFIPIHYHYQMLTDEGRMAGFEAALAALVPEGGRVLELGGGTGVLSYFAARRAARVYCVERLPANAAAARRFLALNGVADRVAVVEADAHHYLPPEPVDVVVCEMLHAAMLREQQIPVIARFKARYLERFGAPLPRFIPEGLVMGVQLVEQSFDFHGFRAPVPLFAPADDPRSRALGPPSPYAIITYEEPYAERFAWTGALAVEREGTANAVRFLTHNVLALLLPEARSIDWRMHNFVVPLPEPLSVAPGQSVRVAFDYAGGDALEALLGSISAARVDPRAERAPASADP